MELKEKERTLIQDLQTQEQSCVEKYGKYAAQAKDPELKSLFETIQKEEQKHYHTLPSARSLFPAYRCNRMPEQRSWCPANIIPMCLHLRIPHFGNCWPISRSKSRTMRK